MSHEAMLTPDELTNLETIEGIAEKYPNSWQMRSVACIKRLSAELAEAKAQTKRFSDNLVRTQISLASSRRESAELREDFYTTLAEIGNLLGGPTMSYSPEYERKEWSERITKAVGIIGHKITAIRAPSIEEAR